MSLAIRAARLTRPPLASSLLSQKRAASSEGHHHDEHDHHHHEADSTVYPAEGLGVTLRNGIIASVVAVGFYKFAPEASEDLSLTRWISKHSTPAETWEAINLDHLAKAQELSTDKLLMSDARKPPMHRYRYPQMFDSYSPHLEAVGNTPSLNDLVIKGDRDQ